MPKQTALVTGASGGIGYELAKLFARDHYDLVLVARSGQKLAELAVDLQRQYEIAVQTIPSDLTRPEAPGELYAQLQRNGVEVDVLVNNAGYGMFGEFATQAPADDQGMMQLNMVALTHLTRLFLLPMLKRGHGKILNVGSTAGFQPGPLMAVYYATKAYVLSFSEALANELKGTGVTLSCLAPGATNTGFQKRADMENSRLFKLGAMDAKKVALAGYRGLMDGKTLIIPGLRNKLLAQSVRLSPRKLVTAIARKVQEKVK